MDSEALRSKVSLHVSPAAPQAQGKRVLAEKIAAGELFRHAEARPAGRGAPFAVGLSNILDSEGREDVSGSDPMKRTHGTGVAPTLVGS